jgi:excisionase family DNA binding protein
MKKVFTTGQVAKVCKVAPRTVSKWFDSGRLRGYRIPGSQHRRIPREHLVRFVKEHDISIAIEALEAEEAGENAILIINLSGQDLPKEVTDDLQLEQDGCGAFKCTEVRDTFTAGQLFEEQEWAVVLVILRTAAEGERLIPILKAHQVPAVILQTLSPSLADDLIPLFKARGVPGADALVSALDSEWPGGNGQKKEVSSTTRR